MFFCLSLNFVVFKEHLRKIYNRCTVAPLKDVRLSLDVAVFLGGTSGNIYNRCIEAGRVFVVSNIVIFKEHLRKIYNRCMGAARVSLSLNVRRVSNGYLVKVCDRCVGTGVVVCCPWTSSYSRST